MSRFQTIAESELVSPTNGYIYKIQRGYRLPEEEGIEKVRIAYWKHRGRRGFGQNAPILVENELGTLVAEAVRVGVLGNQFLSQIEAQAKLEVPFSSDIKELAIILDENDKFLKSNAKGTYDEIVELANDAIDYVFFLVKRRRALEEHSRFAVSSFIYHILMPVSFGIRMNLLSGNPLGCFSELRILVESLGECFIADLKHPECSFFQEKIELVHRDGMRISQRLKELSEDFVALWGKLSQAWLHTRGLVDKIVTRIIYNKDWPLWSLVVPATYTEGDLRILSELRKRVSQFRILLARTVNDWKQQCLVSPN